MSLGELLYNLSVFSVFVPLATGLFYFKRIDRNSRILVILLSCASVAQLASFLTVHKIIRTEVAFYNAYIVIDSIIWGYLFCTNSFNKRIRVAIITIIFSQAILSIFIYYVDGISRKFYTELVCLSSLLQLLWVLSFFYERYKKEEIRALEKEPMFWFCLGLLIYYPTTYFHFAFYGLVEEGAAKEKLQLIHDVCNISMYLVFAIGMLVNVFPTTKLRNVFIRNRS